MVGGITKEIFCKDYADKLNGVEREVEPKCDYLSDEYDFDYWYTGACDLGKKLGDAGLLYLLPVTSWSDLTSQCEELFDTDGGDYKCV